MYEKFPCCTTLFLSVYQTFPTSSLAIGSGYQNNHYHLLQMNLIIILILLA